MPVVAREIRIGLVFLIYFGDTAKHVMPNSSLYWYRPKSMKILVTAGGTRSHFRAPVVSLQKDVDRDDQLWMG